MSFKSHKLIIIIRICKSLFLSGLVLYPIFIVSSQYPCFESSVFLSLTDKCWASRDEAYPPTNISHIVFGIASSSDTWKYKKGYVEAWWRPNVTRGLVFFDRPPTEHLAGRDVNGYKEFDRHQMSSSVIRLARVIAETFKAEEEDVRWYVMADDDTVFFVNNLVEVLGRYDHRKYYYIGRNSECVVTNVHGSFEMAFGGAGLALSYPLARALAKNLDLCIRRYPYLFGHDHILQSCVADLGVSLTHEKGFHQIDLRGDISGYLSSHPQSPFITLHHLDAAHPIFPGTTRFDAITRLMTAAKADESRLLQQTVCYHRPVNWTVSVAWGYSAHIYEGFFPPSMLHRPIETFSPWKKGAYPPYVFNVRPRSEDPCEASHVFFFHPVEGSGGGPVVTRYGRGWPRRLPACGDYSADFVSEVRVLSPVGRLAVGAGSRRECCDVLQQSEANSMLIKIRPCIKDEILG